MLKQDYVPPIFADGPEVGSLEYAAWIVAQNAVKIPFTIWRKPKRLGAVGVHAVPTKLQLFRFSDGALGVPLDERLRMLCADQEPCRVWLAGRFGESMPLPDPDPATVFNVHAVGVCVEGDGPHYAQSVRGPDSLAIRILTPGHCARGPMRCEKCKAAGQEPAMPKLLDVAPYGDYARPTIEIVRGDEKTWRPYDVIRTFASSDEARTFAKQHQITDVTLTQ